MGAGETVCACSRKYPIVAEIGRSVIPPIKPGAQVPRKPVIPAKAGIHFNHENLWIPAFAGMTGQDDRWRARLVLTGGELEPHAVPAGKPRILRSERVYGQKFYATDRNTLIPAGVKFEEKAGQDMSIQRRGISPRRE